MNFAIWTAVSTEAQASPEKISLDEQEQLCRAHALAKGWRETAGPFIVPGQSRTRWVNLRDAETHIPPLKHMLDAAQSRQFDILLLYDYTRLRELLEPVAKTLTAYGIQLYALTQPVEPLPPHEYETNETAATLQFVASFTSRAEIAALKRRYKLGMPRRILAGLHKGKLPHGYRKPPGRELDRKVTPIIDPAPAAVVVKIKDLFLEGHSLWQIAHQLTAERIPTPAGKWKWSDVNVRLLLKNRYYCGEVHFGKTRRTSDPRTGDVKVVDNLPSRIITAKGLHPPLWDMPTQRRIDEEFNKRGKKYTGIRTQRLSNLLHCGVCGARAWVSYPGGYADSRRRWVCSVHPKHVNRKDTDLLPAFIAELAALLRRIENAQLPQQPADGVQLHTAALADLTARRKRLTDAYELGVLPIQEYTARTASLDAQINDTLRTLAATDTDTERSAQRRAAIHDLRAILHKLPNYLTEAPPQQVNTHLRAFIHKIIITNETVTIQLLP
jgi:DNA invertase Pin-like site-specific DNA recombinase